MYNVRTVEDRCSDADDAGTPLYAIGCLTCMCSPTSIPNVPSSGRGKLYSLCSALMSRCSQKTSVGSSSKHGD